MPEPFVNAASLDGLIEGDLAPDLRHVFTALQGFVEEVLVAHDAEFAGRGATYYEDARTEGRARAHVLDRLGDPARYYELVWRGLAGQYDGRDLHRFDVLVCYGQGEATREAHALAFRDLAYRQDVAPSEEGRPGLLYALLRATLDADVDGELVELHKVRPESADAQFVKGDAANGDYRWELSFSIALG